MKKCLFAILFSLCLWTPTPARADALWFKMLDMMITPLPVDDSSSWAKLAVSFLQQQVSSLLALHENFSSYLSVDGLVAGGIDAFKLMGGKDETATALLSLWTSARKLTEEIQVSIIEPLEKMMQKVNGLRSRVESTISKVSRAVGGGGSVGGKGGIPKLNSLVSYVDIAKSELADVERTVETNVGVSLDTTTAGTVYEFRKSDYFKQQTTMAVLARSMESRYRLNELVDLLEELNKMDENTLIQAFSKGQSSPSNTGDISVNAQLYDIWDKLLALEELIMAERLQLKAGQMLMQYSESPRPTVASSLSGAEEEKEDSSSNKTDKEK